MKIEFAKVEAICNFNRLGQKTVSLILPRVDRYSDAEITFQALGALSFEERSDIFEIIYLEDVDGEMFDHSMGTQKYTPAKTSINDEVCPGCGCEMAVALNPLCEHPAGCGSKRSIPDSTPYEENQ